MTTIYIKTCSHCGLKYLGKTYQDKPSYKGSGLHWKRHIKKHKADIDTKVIAVSESKRWIKFLCLMLSKHYDIVNSKEWANLIPENGSDGAPEGNKIWLGRNHSEETKQKLREMNLGKKNPSYGNTTTNYMYGRKHTEEAKEKMRKTQSGRVYRKKECENCGRKIGLNNFKRHTDKCLTQRKPSIPQNNISLI